MKKLAVLALAAAVIAMPAAAKEVTVQMLNKGASGAMVFEPAMVKIAPGDTVKFVPTNPSHQAEAIPTMWVAGVQQYKGKMNQAVSMKFDKPGVYGIKCLPHFAMGMIALIQVGTASPNLAAAKAAVDKLAPLAKKRMAPLLASAK